MIDLLEEIEQKSEGFLKWVGSKKWLKKELLYLINKVSPENYHEPFLGSGAIFFSRDFKKSYLNDINIDLITTYKVVKKNPTILMEHLNKMVQNEKKFYEIRNTKPTSEIEIASRFIYLNKTSFNGLYRENKNGEFNASYGKRKFDKKILNDQIFSSSIKLQNAKLTSIDFYETLSNVKKNDLVFLDPPYSLSKGIGYNRYNSIFFSAEDQKRILNYIEEIKRRKAFYILTNEYNDNTVGLFKVLEDYTLIAKRKSIVSAKLKGRKLYKEIIITNIK